MTGTATITDLAVASYLAKYSTKGTEVTGHASARITADTITCTPTLTAPTPNGSSRPAGTSALTRTTPACAAGPTCSASAGTS